jgi:transcriptional regulator, GntR family
VLDDLTLLPPETGEALHTRTERTLRAAIGQGRLPQGTRLPGHRALAAALGVSRNTLVDALAQLEIEGYVEVRGRSGTRVCVPPDEAAPPSPPPLPLSAWARRALGGQVEDAGGEYEFDLRIGQPVPELYPARAWAQALARRAAAPHEGEGLRDPLGPPETRRALAAYLRSERGAQVTPEMILLTGGTQSSLDALSRILLEPGRLAVTEQPGYPGAHAAFSATGAQVLGAAVDGGGLRPGDLPARADLLYLTPACQYPTTVTLGAARRQEVIRWARRSGAFVLEDDYAADLHWQGRPPSVLQGQAPDRVILLGSFSKSLAPVTRSGFVVAPPEVTEVLSRTRPLTDRVPGVLDALALADVLASGAYTRHLRRARALLAHRGGALLTALRTELPQWEALPARAGLHLYVRLPPGSDEQAILASAARLGVALSPARSGEAGGEPAVLLAFGHLSPEALRRAVRRLRALS